VTRILVTGADGFVGRALVSKLVSAGDAVRGTMRRDDSPHPPNVVPVGDLRDFRGWPALLEGVDTVVHLAARAHVTNEKSDDPLAKFRAVNVWPTIALFKSCQQASVSRFVFISSIGVNGVMTSSSPFNESDLPNPSDPYAQSKFEAELGLSNIVESGPTDLVVLRPALIYGPHVKGNLLRLMRWVDRGCPIPLVARDSSRSLLGLDKFCELVALCIAHPAARNQVFVASDEQPISARELVLAIGQAMRRKVRLVRVPRSLLSVLGSMVGKRAELDRFSGSLEVDPSKAKKLLNWNCGGDITPELNSMVQVYLDASSAN
jgi:nucleoside-diphosphate-sugar epimerase